jgi:glutamate racemase
VSKFAEPAGVKVLTVTSLKLVPFVEAGEQMSEACLVELHNILQPVVDQGADFLTRLHSLSIFERCYSSDF